MYNLKRVHIEISTLCNSHCITCPHDKIDRAEIIDIQRVNDIIKQDCLAYKDSIELFEFHNYNEPLLTFNLFYRLAQLVNRIYGEYKVGLVSNGSIMTEDVANKLIGLKLRHIWFSVDGFSKEVFEAHRRGLNWETVYRNIVYFTKRCKLLKDYFGEYLYPYISFVITNKNRHEIKNFKDYFSSLHCHYSLQDCDGRGGEGKEPVMKNIWAMKPCNYALDGIYILSNLDVVPCCLDWAGIAVMGNLGSQTVQDVVEGKKYRNFRKKQMTGRKEEIPLCAQCQTNMIYGYPRYTVAG